MSVKIVNVRKEICDVYIGRCFGGWDGSKFANPYQISHQRDREGAITMYKKWLRQEIKGGRITWEELAALDGKRLGCWCHPLPCHGDVLAVFIDTAVKLVGSRVVDSNI